MIRFLYAACAALARALPPIVAYALARAAALVFWAASASRRRAVRANLGRVAPELPARARERLARRMFMTFAESMVDAGRALGSQGAGTVTIEGADRLRAALDAGHGVLLWSAHLGNWELAAAALARGGFEVSALARAHDDPGLESYFDATRRAAGVRVVARCPGAREARRVLRGRGLLALLGDRRFGVGGRAVPFFGSLARLPAAPLALAHRTGAALVPGFVVRTSPGRYRVHVEPAVTASGDGALASLAATLERYVRAHPEQWYVFEPMWDDARPMVEPS
jgi:KDO2-lipid IV(A) lauroyltransferase